MIKKKNIESDKQNVSIKILSDLEKQNIELQQLTSLINIRNYIAIILNSNCKHITKADINEIFPKLAEIDIKAMKLIKEMKV